MSPLTGFRTLVAALLGVSIVIVADLAHADLGGAQASRPSPLRFEANRGQAPSDVQFLARSRGYQLSLTATEVRLDLREASQRFRMGARDEFFSSRSALTKRRVFEAQSAPLNGDVVRWHLVGATPRTAVGDGQLPGVVSYLRGNDASRWLRNIPTFHKVRFPAVYPGIDVVYYGSDAALEYDIVVQPGADPGRVVLEFDGVRKLEVDARGDLVIHGPSTTVHQRKPVVYQQVGGARLPVAGRYVIRGPRQVGFEVADYRRDLALVIDPIVDTTTGLNVVSDSVVTLGGFRYEVGFSPAPPDPNNPDEVLTPPGFGGGLTDLFVAKFDSATDTVQWVQFLRGNGTEFSAAGGITVDGSGNVYVAGVTSSTDFPIAGNAPQPAYGGGIADAFVAKFANDAVGTLVFSTYLGGSGADFGQAVTVETVGAKTFVYVTGGTASGATPTTAFPTFDASQAAFGGGPSDAFVAKLDPDAAGSEPLLVYSTYLGGTFDETGTGITLVAPGVVEVVGESFDPSVVSTFPEERASMLAFAPTTRFSELEEGLQQTFNGFPIVNPAQNKSAVEGPADAFLTRLGPPSQGPGPGSTVVASTFLGGTGLDRAFSVAKDGAGSTYVTGWTDSTDFVTVAAVQSVPGGGIDTFVVKLSSPPAAPQTPTITYSTYVGGDGNDLSTSIAVTPAGDAYVVGVTDSTSAPAPTVPPVADPSVPEVFVTKLGAPVSQTTPSPTLGFAVSAGSNGAESGTFLGATVDATGNVFVAGSKDDGLALKIVNAAIDVRPNARKNNVNTKSKTVRVAILSSATFDASKDVDLASLTFGHFGSEPSLVKCEKKARKVNRDTFKDLVCTFRIKTANFQAGDTTAILKGKLVAGGDVVGSDTIRVIVPKARPHDHEDQHGNRIDRDDENDDLD